MGVNFCNNVREIKYYFNFWGIRKTKRKKGAQKKGGWKFTHFTSPGSAPDYHSVILFCGLLLMCSYPYFYWAFFLMLKILYNRDLKIHVYCEWLTARDHVTRARRHVWGFELAFWTSRGGFSRKSFTSSFIALNFILCHVQIWKSNKVTLFLQIGLIFQANKQLPSVLLLFVDRHWS